MNLTNLKKKWRFLKSDPRIQGTYRLLLSSLILSIVLSTIFGAEKYANTSLSMFESITSLSAVAVLAIAASAIAVIGFFREIPAWSQSFTKSGGGQSVYPSRRPGQNESHPTKAGISLKTYGIARRYVLESVTLSIPTNDLALASAFVLNISSKDKNLYEGAIAVGNDILSGDESIGNAGYFSVTRSIESGFSGDLEYSIYNNSDQMLMCYVVLRMRSVHSLGELILEKYFPAIARPLIELVSLVNRILMFQPDTWYRGKKAASARKKLAT